MALLPYVMDSWLDEYDPYYVNRLLDQNFGLGIWDNDMGLASSSWKGLATPFRSGYLRTMRHLLPEESGISTIQNTKDEFKVALDVQQFKPEEIKVRVADDCIIVDGKHEERQDEHGFISREFTRKYHLPKNVKMESINSTLSSDGILQIVAPKKVEAIQGKEREIKITRSNQPAIKAKQSKM